MLVSAFYQFMPKSEYNPNFHLGSGLAYVDPIDTSHRSAFAANAGLGVDLYDGKKFTLGFGVDYYLVLKNAAMKHEFQVAVASIKFGFWPGGTPRKAEPCCIAAAPAVAPAPVVPVAAAPAPLAPPAPVAAQAPVDTDGDGVTDDKDKCPGTSGMKVDAAGCPAGSQAEVTAFDRLLQVAAPDSVTPGIVSSVRGAAGDPACPWQDTGKLCMKLAMEFDGDKSELKGDFAAQLKEISAFLTANPAATMLLEGYTDNHGDTAHNMKLSEDRANSVMKHFVEVDRLPASRFSIKGMGEAQPVGSNLTEEGRQANRRVIALLSMGKTN